MWGGIKSILFVTIVSSVVLQESVVCFPLPMDQTSPSEATPILSGQAADDRARVPGEVLLVRTDDQQEAIDRQTTPQQPFNPPGVLRPILPPLDTHLENEIWQYRYPPFDTLFNANNPADEEPDSSESESALTGIRSPRFDSLPSYVIGILDPAELVDGLFHQRPFDSSNGGIFRSGNVDVLSNRNSVPVSPDGSDDFVESNEFNNNFKTGIRRDSNANLEAQPEKPNKVFGVPKIILEADDRWIWRSIP